MNACMPVLCREVNGFKIQGYNCTETIKLPSLYSRHEFPHDRSHIPTASICNQFSHLTDIAHKLMPIQNVEVGLLLGYDVGYVHQHQDIVRSKDTSEPYAVRTPLGWCVIGSTGRTSNVNTVFCNRISCSKRTSIVYKTEVSQVTPKDVINVFEQDFNDVRDQPPLSREDKQFLHATAYRKHLPDGHYEIPMPCKESVITLERNLPMVEQRLEYLKRKMEKNDDYKQEYVTFINEMIKNDFCERVPVYVVNKPSWYIPHHGVYHRV